jgi:hypothetical protein
MAVVAFLMGAGCRSLASRRERVKSNRRDCYWRDKGPHRNSFLGQAVLAPPGAAVQVERDRERPRTVADGQCLLVSSANLTERAFNLNIAIGVLVRGGDLPRRAEADWTSLIRSGGLRRIAE